MVASVAIMEHNGSGGTQTNKAGGSVRFKNADDATVDLVNPLVVPTSGQEYSFEKWLRLAITGGTYVQIDNLQVYTDGSNGFGTGVKLWYALAGVFSQPVVPAEGVDPPQSPAAGSPVENMADVFALVTGSRGNLDAINAGPFIGSPDLDIGDFIVLVMEVEATASNGVLAAETLTFSYDEI